MIIPIVVAAIALGRSFDMKAVKPGSFFIFDNSSIAENLQIIPRSYTSAQYRLIEESSDMHDFLDVNGELSLLSKMGAIDLQGFGKYMIQPINRERTVELLVSVYHETQTDTFTSFAKQRDDWRKHSPKDVGSHYIRSIVYGGQLLISYKMIANKAEYMEEIKAAVSGSIQASGKLDASVAGNLDKLRKEIGGKFRLSIEAFATTGLFDNPTNLKEVLTLIDEYPGMVKNEDNGKGSPMKLELVPISTLNPDYQEYRRNFAMESIANEAANKYDDLKIAETEFKAWERTQLWNDEQQKLINVYIKEMKRAMSSMVDAITSLDLSQEVNFHHFEEAFKTYGEGRNNIPNRYVRGLTRLIHTVEQIPFYWFPYTKSVTHYVHWGSVNCSMPSPEPIYVGYAASSPKGFGSGANLLCLDIEPSKENNTLPNSTPVSYMNGLSYQTPSNVNGYAYCAFCKLENATSAITVAGRMTCPEDMKFEYSGYLATNAKSVSELICMDDVPDDKIVDLHAGEDRFAGKIVPIWAKCPDCEEEEKDKFVACAVCSR